MTEQTDLQYNLQGIEGYDPRNFWIRNPQQSDLPEDERDLVLHPATEALIFIAPQIGIKRITKENAYDVFRRIRLLEIFQGRFIWHGSQSAAYPPEEVTKHIGLETSAEAFTYLEFKMKLLDAITESIQAEWGAGR